MSNEIVAKLTGVPATQTPTPAQLDIQQLLLETPLYVAQTISEADVIRIRARSIQFDAHCVWCARSSVFKIASVFSGSVPDWIKQPGTFDKQAVCSRDSTHVYDFFFKLFSNGKLVKVGQFPSIADVSGTELVKYRPLLRDGYYEELTKANGLISHGVGIGSFVYLRRIFEKLILDHYQEKEAISGPIEGFNTLRMDEKIACLKDYLPPALVRNRATYGILSSGIHSLGEEQCKLYFPVVKSAIIQILQQDFDARESKRQELELESQIAKIADQLRKS